MDHEDGDGDGAGLDGGVDGDSGGGMEKTSGGDSGGVSWFCVSPPPPRETPRGTIFIVGFRSRRSHGDENRRHRSHEGKNKGSHAAKESSHVGPPISVLGLPFLRILGSYVFFLPNIGPRIILGHLDVIWVPDSQKHGKRGFLVLQG